MYCEGCSEPVEVTDVVRKQNRTLRRIVASLRRAMRTGHQHADELFLALCETDVAAERAMRELWESGYFNCGPQDYDQIVEESLAALSAVKTRQSARSHPQDAANRCDIPAKVRAYGWSCTREHGQTVCDGPRSLNTFAYPGYRCEWITYIRPTLGSALAG